jgi:hypothetical protein
VTSTHYKLFSADIRDIPKLDSVIRMAEMDPRYILYTLLLCSLLLYCTKWASSVRLTKFLACTMVTHILLINLSIFVLMCMSQNLKSRVFHSSLCVFLFYFLINFLLFR